MINLQWSYIYMCLARLLLCIALHVFGGTAKQALRA